MTEYTHTEHANQKPNNQK